MLGVVEGGINVGVNFFILWFNYFGFFFFKKFCFVILVMFCVFDCYYGELFVLLGFFFFGINCYFFFISICWDGNYIRGINYVDVVVVEEDFFELGVVVRVVEFCYVFEDYVCFLLDLFFVWNGKEDGKVGLCIDVIIEVDEGVGEF